MRLCSANAQTMKHQTTAETHIKIMREVSDWAREEVVVSVQHTHTFVRVPNSCLFGYMICFLKNIFFFLLVHLFSCVCPLCVYRPVCVCVCMRVEWPPRRWSMQTFSLRNGGMCPCVGRPFPHLFPAQPSVCVRADSQHLSLPNARAQWTLHIKSAPRSGCVRG